MKPIKGKGRILVTIPEHYMVNNWSFSDAEKIPEKTVDLTSWITGKGLPKRRIKK